MQRVSLDGVRSEHFPKTEQMLMTDDGQTAFSVIDGMPVLLWPEAWTTRDELVDLNDRNYVEAYSEMSFYNTRAAGDAADVAQDGQSGRPAPRFQSDAELRENWVDFMVHDSAALLGTLDYLSPLAGSDFVQLGGDGRFAIKALRAGARRAVLVTPMVSEARHARAMARRDGVEDRLLCVIGIGEELPLAAGAVDKIFSPATMHHMRLDQVFPQMKRALKVAGRFAAYDPWRAPLYGIGNAVFGKRNTSLFTRSAGVMCNPLTEESLHPLAETFASTIRRHHGPVLRYPICACEKFGIRLKKPLMQRIAQLDDQLGEMLGLDQSWGSSVMFGGEA